MTRLRHLIIIAAGYFASALAYSRLRELSVDSSAEWQYITAGMALALPTTGALTYVLFSRLWMRDALREREPAFEATYDAILFRVLLFVLVLHVAVLAGLVGLLAELSAMPRLVVVLVGLALVGVGNLLPRTRPNLVVGIRTAKTLTDRTLWMQMHRLSGYVSVALGMVIILAGVFLSKSMIPVVIAAVGLAGSAIIANSYWRYSPVSTGQ